MEDYKFLLNSPYLIPCLLGAICAIFVQYFFKRNPRAPPGPYGLPILGYLPFLTKNPYRKLDSLTKKYGSVFSISLGSHNVVVVGSKDAAKEVLGKNAFLGRSPLLPLDILPGGFGFLGYNGKAWHEQKSFSLRILRDVGFGKSPVEVCVQEEASELFESIDKFKGQPLDISEMLMSSVSNVITTLVFGRRLPHNDPVRENLNKAVDDGTKRFAITSIITYVPALNFFVAPLKKLLYPADKDLYRLSDFTREEVKKHREASESGGESWDYIHQYISEIEKQKSRNEVSSFTDESLIGNVQLFFAAGTETTRTTLYWAIVAMAAYPKIQKKVQEEIDEHLGRDRFPVWEDRAQLPYVQCVLQESSRWRTAVPLGVFRWTTEDTTVLDYDIPKYTTVIINQHGVHRDPTCWEDAEEFRPERHMSEDGKRCLKLEGVIPFSSGRRNCPGEGLAVMEVFMFFTSFLQRYNITPPDGAVVDVTDHFQNVVRPVPQTLCFKKRN